MTNSNVNKTRTATTFMATLVIGLAMIIPTMAPQYVDAMQNVDCAKKLTPVEYDMINSIDANKAKRLATSSNLLQSELKGYKYQSNSFFTGWSWNPADCTNLTLHNVNVVYTLTNHEGKYVRHVIVTEDPSLTKVLEVAEQNANVTHQHDNVNWSGWELNPGYEVKEVTMPWTMPTVSAGTGVTCSTTTACATSIWSGIEDAYGGSNHLVQAGTDQNVTCGTCSSNDYVWYEALNDKTVYCNGYSYHATESVYSDVTNEDRTNQANAGIFDFTIADNKQGVSCTGSIDYSSYMTTTGDIGVFMLERPTYSTGMAYLAQFTNGTATGTSYMYYNGASNQITTSGMSGYRQDYMANPSPSFTNLNANPSSISSGAFSEYYHNSNGE